jgi:nicotinamide mononucleotide transporter
MTEYRFSIFRVWSTFEIIWLLTFLAVGIYLSYAWDSSWFALSVMVAGIVCVVLTAKGIIWSFLIGLYNSIGYGWIAYQNGLFGEVGLNWFFFVPTAIIGFFLWRGHMNGAIVTMRALSLKASLVVATFCLVAFVALGYALSLIDGQNTPYIDALTNVLSVAATILTIYRFREQWLVYIVLNVFSVIMWVLRVNEGGEAALLMVLMWSAYLINACYGYWNWHKGLSGSQNG